jgi:hypothetical protein
MCGVHIEKPVVFSVSSAIPHVMEPGCLMTAHKSPPLVPILIQVNPSQTLPSYLFNVHFNITYLLRVEHIL